MDKQEIVTQNFKDEIKRKIKGIKSLAEVDVGEARRQQEELFNDVIEAIAEESVYDPHEIAKLAMSVWDIEFYDCGCSSNWSYADIGLDLSKQVDVVKKYKYLIMSLIPKKNNNARTDKYLVTNKSGDLIGLIWWRNGFRQYVFTTHTKYAIDLSRSCMRDLCDFIDELMEKRKER